jgi:hypothetical protein
MIATGAEEQKTRGRSAGWSRGTRAEHCLAQQIVISEASPAHLSDRANVEAGYEVAERSRHGFIEKQSH